MGQVVLDRMQLETVSGRRELARQPRLERGDLRQVARPAERPAEAPRVAERQRRLAQQVGARLARDGDAAELGQAAGADRVETELDRLAGEARPVLDAAEALLLDPGGERAVAEDRRRGVGVEGVEAEDRLYAQPEPPFGAPRRSARSRSCSEIRDSAIRR